MDGFLLIGVVLIVGESGKKKGASAREKTERLWTHAAHVACLTYHGFVRNHWINDRLLHNTLLSHLDATLITSIKEFNNKSKQVEMPTPTPTPRKASRRQGERI